MKRKKMYALYERKIVNGIIVQTDLAESCVIFSSKKAAETWDNFCKYKYVTMPVYVTIERIKE